MAERNPEQGTAPEPAPKRSRAISGFRRAFRGAEPRPIAILGLGLAAAVLLVIAELSTIVSVEVLTATCEDLALPADRDDCEKTGGEQHAYGLLVVAAFAALMAWGASLGGSRPAAAALVAAGVLTLAIALIVDVPDVDETGAIGRNFDEADANPGTGLWLELIGGALAVAAGTLALRRRTARSDDAEAPDG